MAAGAPEINGLLVDPPLQRQRAVEFTHQLRIDGCQHVSRSYRRSGEIGSHRGDQRRGGEIKEDHPHMVRAAAPQIGYVSLQTGQKVMFVQGCGCYCTPTKDPYRDKQKND